MINHTFFSGDISCIAGSIKGDKDGAALEATFLTFTGIAVDPHDGAIYVTTLNEAYRYSEVKYSARIRKVFNGVCSCTMWEILPIILYRASYFCGANGA